MDAKSYGTTIKITDIAIREDPLQLVAITTDLLAHQFGETCARLVENGEKPADPSTFAIFTRSDEGSITVGFQVYEEGAVDERLAEVDTSGFSDEDIATIRVACRNDLRRINKLW